MSDDTAVLEHQEAQRNHARRASLDLLRSKSRAQQEYEFEMETPEGKVKATFLFRAVSAAEWDRLITDNPPTTAQRGEQQTYNPDTFCPALMSKVCIDPQMNAAEWGELWNSPDWNKGELSELFWAAAGLCNRGLDVNPTEAV